MRLRQADINALRVSTCLPDWTHRVGSPREHQRRRFPALPRFGRGRTGPLGAGGRAFKSPSHRGQKAVQRLQGRWPSIIPVHTPVHASWLNQVEIYFSIIQRKVVTPCDFASLADLEAALLAFQYRYEKSAAPFRWTFTRDDLAALMQRLKARALSAAA
jgi:hypothetical protein